MTDDKLVDDDATDAPEHVRYPVPLAYQTTSPFVHGDVSPAPVRPSVPPAAVRKVPDEPWGLLDLVEPPETYGVDELALLARDPWTLFCWWEATSASIAAARTQLGGEGFLVLRLYVVQPSGPAQVLDIDLGHDWGRRYLGAPRSGTEIMAALGVRAPDGRFAVLARAPRCAVPPGEPSEGPVEWMEVAPPRTAGARREAPAIVEQGTGAADSQRIAELWRVPFGVAPGRAPARGGATSPGPTGAGPTRPGPTSPSPTSPTRPGPTSPTRGRR